MALTLVPLGAATQGSPVTVSTVTSATTLSSSSDQIIRADATSGGFPINLPAVVTEGRSYSIKKTDASAYVVTIVGTIEGSTNMTLGVQGQAVTLTYNALGWEIRSVYSVPRDPYVNLYAIEFEVDGDGTDDTAGWQEAVTATVARSGKLIVPPPKYGQWHSIRDTIEIVPASGTQVWVSIESTNPGNSTIRFEPTTSNKKMFHSLGWYGGTVSLGVIQVVGKTGAVLFDLDANATYASTGGVSFDHTWISFLSSCVSCVGYRLGHSAASENIAGYSWDQCVVGADAAGGHIGWVNEGANSLPHRVSGGGMNHMTKGFTNTPTSGAVSTQGSASWHFEGISCTSNVTDLEFKSPGVYTVIGSYFETGETLISTPAGVLQTFPIVFHGNHIGDYAPSDGRVFRLGPDANVDFSFIGNKAKRDASAHDANLITFHSSGGYASLTAHANTLRCADPFYQFIGGVAGTVDVSNNTRLDTNNNDSLSRFRGRRDFGIGGEMTTERVGYAAPDSQGFFDAKGSTFRRLDGGAATCFYVKETTAASETGWVAK